MIGTPINISPTWLPFLDLVRLNGSSSMTRWIRAAQPLSAPPGCGSVMRERLRATPPGNDA
jgi:hypothetical protein